MNIMADITGNCNLRCPFCINDWSKTVPIEPMTHNRFRTLLELAKCASDGAFFVSCGFEPLVHPEFTDLISMIPAELKSKAFLSTNLSLPMSDEAIRVLAEGNLSYVNVSFESFNPSLYERYRRGAQFDTFIHNFTRLAEARKTVQNPVGLRVISMAFEENASNLPGLVHRCADEFGVQTHEIRVVFGACSEHVPPFMRFLSVNAAFALRSQLSDRNMIWRLGDEAPGELSFCPTLRVYSDGRASVEG